MSTIRKAYMEISNGIRGLRFHNRDQSINNNSTTSSEGGGSNRTSNSDDSKTIPVASRTSKNSVHAEEGALTCAVSRFLPNSNKSSCGSSSSILHSNNKQEQVRNGSDHGRFISNSNHLPQSSSSPSSSSPSSSSSISSSPSHQRSSSFLSSSSSSSSSSSTAASHGTTSSPSLSSRSGTALSSSSSSSPSTKPSFSHNANHNIPNGKAQTDNNSAVNKLRNSNKDHVFTQTKLVGSPKAGIASRIRKLNLSMTGQKWTTKPETIHELMMDERFIAKFFFYFSVDDRRRICQVCKRWKAILYQTIYWPNVLPVINFKEWTLDVSGRKLSYENFQHRGFDNFCFVGATDRDVTDFVNNISTSKKQIRGIGIRCSNLSDAGLENLIRRLPHMNKLELSNCNEITGSGLWACLNPKITILTVSDCIHIADDSVGAIAQLLPSLYELNLQAYHVTDNGLALFDSKLNSSIRVLRLKSCWEITNHGVVNIIHALPNVTVLSLAGCSKVTDDGIEIIAENMKKLKSFDISWCSRVTDASLEYVACDLSLLEELVLDRCCHLTDIGIGYISTMTSLLRLYVRWCAQVGDFGLHHIFSMRNLRALSVAGCRRLTSNGLYGLRHLQRLNELELTNCPGATPSVSRYLKDNLPNTWIIE